MRTERLGTTLMHEHIFVRDPELERNLPELAWDRDAQVERAVAILTELHALGIGTVVDLTVLGLGRDVASVREVAERVPLHLVAATGLYGTTLPLYFAHRGPGRLMGGIDALAEHFVRDIEEGIEGTDVRAAIIKVRTADATLAADEEWSLAAAASAHARTGVAISTHSVADVRNGLVQQEFLLGRGVPAERIVIGHCGDSADLDYLRRIMDRGSTIGMDRFGMAHVLGDEARVETVGTLVAAGYAERMVLSHDAAVWSHVTPPAWRAEHAPDWDMAHLPRHIVPELRARGVAERDLEQMLVRNPARLLGAGVRRT